MDGAKKDLGVERGIEFDTSPKAGEVLTHDGAEGLDFLFVAFLQGFIEGLDIGIEAHGRQGRHVEPFAKPRGYRSLIAGPSSKKRNGRPFLA
jgi:hypothetical protein